MLLVIFFTSIFTLISACRSVKKINKGLYIGIGALIISNLTLLVYNI